MIRHIFNLFERILVLLLFSGLLIPLSLSVIWRSCFDRFPKQELSIILRRWIHFAKYGLRSLRRRWWVPLCYESYSVLWRYAVLAELSSLLNLAFAATAKTRTDNYLAIRMGHPGDLIQAIPMLRQLRKNRPQARISLLVGPWCVDLARRIAYVDEVIVYCPALRQYHRSNRSNMCSLSHELQVLWALRRRNSDICFSLEPHHILDVALQYAIRPRQWIGMKEDSSPYQPAVIVRSILFDSRQPEAEMLMGLLAVAGQETGSTQLEFPVREEDRLWVQQVIRRENLKPGQYAVLAPGAGWPGKIWSAERFAELGDWLQQERGLGVVLAGSSSENALGVLVLSQMQHMPLSLMGQTSLGQIGALLESAALYVGNDSAILHIASSVGIPSVALFGPTYAEKWAPRGMQHRYLQHRKTVCQANCHPWHVEARCNRGQVCMKAITVAEVQQAIADVCMASGPKP